jgi:hypothetical protein
MSIDDVPTLDKYSTTVRDDDILASRLSDDEASAKAQVKKRRQQIAAGGGDERANRIADIAAGKTVSDSDDLDHLLRIETNRWSDKIAARELHHRKSQVNRTNAARAYCAEIKKPADAIPTRLVAALVEAQAAHLEYFNLQTDLRANGIGFHDICVMQFWDLLGSPTDRTSRLADTFREAVKLRLLNRVPEGLR